MAENNVQSKIVAVYHLLNHKPVLAMAIGSNLLYKTLRKIFKKRNFI